MADDVNINIGINPSTAESGAKRATKAVSSVAQSNKDLEASFKRIKTSLDPTWQAQQRYNQALADVVKLQKADRLSKDEANAARKAAKKAFEDETAAINRRIAAAQALANADKAQAAESAAAARKKSQDEIAAARAATQEKINLARQERNAKQELFRQEQAQIKLAAQLARQAAADAARANRPVSQRAIGPVAPGSRDTTASVAQLEYRIQQAMGKLTRLTQEAEDAAVRAANASSATIAQKAQQTAQARSAAAQETKDRILEMERDLASQVGAILEEQTAQEKAANAQKKADAKAAASAAAKAAKDTADAKKLEVKANREAAKAADDLAKAEARQAQELQEMRASINPAFAAQTRYNETMQRATSLLMSNKLAEGEWIAIQKQAAIQMEINTRQMGRANQVGIQLGYQVQDVAASLASGINPLVIFAQQSGQFAYAMQMAGGRTAAFAAILGGVWVQAALAAIIVLTQLFGAEKKHKETTLDLIDIEKIRTATLDELTDSLKNFNEQQERANRNTDESIRLNEEAAKNAEDRAYQLWIDAKVQLNAAKQALADAENDVAGRLFNSNQATANIIGLRYTVKELTDEVNKAAAAWQAAQKAMASTSTARLDRDAEAKLDPAKAIDQKYNIEETKATKEFESKKAQLLKILDLNERNARISALEASYERVKLDLLTRRKAELDAYNKSKRDSDETRMEDFSNPLKSMTVTSPFGMRNGRMHKGVDLRASVGTPVYATQSGVVDKKTGLNIDPKGYGNLITLDFGAGTKALFGHLSKILVKPGQTVNMGDLIGYSGGAKGAEGAGDSQAPHLHYEVRRNNKPVDPLKGKYPTDSTATGAEALKAAQEAAKQLARDLSAAIDTKEELIREDDSKPLEDQLKEVKALEDSRIEIMRTTFGAESKEFEEAQRKKLKIVDAINQQIVQREQARIRQEQAIAEAAMKAKQEVESENLGAKSDVVNYKADNGIISARQAVVEKARLLDQEYQMQQRHEREMYELHRNALMAELALDNLKPERRLEINNQLKQIEAEYLGQRESEQAQYARRVAEVNRQQADVAMAGWKEITSSLSSMMSSTFQGLWTRSITVGQALLNMADQMVYRLADIGIRAAQQELENWIRVHIIKQRLNQTELIQAQAHEATHTALAIAGTTARTGATVAAAATEGTVTAATTGAKVASEAIKTGAAVTGAATQTAASAAAGTTEIGTNAAVAAAGAYKSTVVIPFIGPVAAPVAAGLALAAVLGFAALISARGGQGEVGEDGQLSILHKKEMVLPEKFATPLRAQLTARSSSGMIGSATFAGTSIRESSVMNQGGPTFNYQPKHTNMGASLDTLLRQDGRTMRRWLQNEFRNGGFGRK